MSPFLFSLFGPVWYWLHCRIAELAKNSKLVGSCCHFRQNSVMALPVMVNPLPGKSRASRTSLGSGSSPRPWMAGTQILIVWSLLTFKSGQARSAKVLFSNSQNEVTHYNVDPPSAVASSKSADSSGRVPGPKASRKRATSASCFESISILSGQVSCKALATRSVQGMVQLRCVGRSKTLRTSGSCWEVASARMKFDLVLVPFFIGIACCSKQLHYKL